MSTPYTAVPEFDTPAFAADNVSQRPDYNSLDNTVAGRILLSAAVGLIYALPDYVQNRLLRWALDAGIVAGLVASNVVINELDDDPTNDFSTLADGTTITLKSPVLTWAVIVAALGLIVAGTVLDAKLRGLLASGLMKVGVRRPHTVIGVVTAFLTLALLDEAANRDRR